MIKMEERKKEKIIEYIRTILKDKYYIIIILILMLLIFATALAADTEKKAIEQYYKNEMDKCGCVKVEPYKFEYNIGDEYEIKNNNKDT